MSAQFLDRFAATCRQWPDNTAVLTDGFKKLSYRDLANRAAGIAAALKSKHVKPGEIIGIHIEKSADYIAAHLGCWMAGAAFMPLDPSLPEERRRFILQDSGVTHVIAQFKHLVQLEGALLDIITVEDIPASLPPAEIMPLPPEQLAYAIYTSGSTGQPKGVLVPHRGICNLLDEQIAAFQLHAGSRSLFYLSTSFDASLSDIWTALLSGATLCIETAGGVETAAQLAQIVAARGITYMDIPPSLLRLLDPADMPKHLETIVIGGETCPPDIVRRWASHFRIVNVYGPTEATVCTSHTLCDAGEWRQPHIGRPMKNVTYLVVDAEMREVAVGAEGELLIGGIQLALGYLNRPELTARKFITLDGKAFYRTGDLVRNDASGSPVFIGRLDRQIKLRGQLIELEEVEAAFLQDPAIAQIAAVKRPVRAGEASGDTLIGFLTRVDGRLTPYEPLADIHRILPPWMLPRHFIVLEAMPLTATGKIDHQALIRLDIKNLMQDIRSEGSALSAEERKLAGLWSRVLKIDDIAPTDDFFALGGDSFGLLQLSLEAELSHITLPPGKVVELRTLSKIARWIAAQTPLSAHATGEKPAEELRRDAAPDAAMQDLIAAARALPASTDNPAAFFFTGATGFLGAWLLRDMMRQRPGAIFYALVRAADEAAAMRRIGEAFARQDLVLTPDMRRRIIPVCGDFSQRQFGLSTESWRHYAEKTDCIIHCGATINMVLPYDALYDANVGGVQEITTFALTGRRKKLHYASTLSVFVSTDQNTGEALENDRLEQTKTVYGGYAQTKWAAEYFLHQIPADVLDISIYRLGLVTGDTVKGQGSPKDFIDMFMRGILSLAAVPAGDMTGIEVDVTPIDYCAAAMAHIILTAPATQGSHHVYHLANTRGFSLGMILEALRARGHALPAIPAADWQAAMTSRASHGFTVEESAAYLGLGRLLPDKETFERHRAIDLFQATGIVFKQESALKALAGSGISCPAADRKLLLIYLNNGIEYHSHKKVSPP